MIHDCRAGLKEHLLCKANEVFVVSVDVGELDVYQQQNLQHKTFKSRVSVASSRIFAKC